MVSQVLVGCVDLASEEHKCHDVRGQSEGRGLGEKILDEGRCMRLCVRRTNDKYMTCDEGYLTEKLHDRRIPIWARSRTRRGAAFGCLMR